MLDLLYRSTYLPLICLFLFFKCQFTLWTFMMKIFGLTQKHGLKYGNYNLFIEIIIRIALIAIFIVLERLDPFIRVIQPEEIWMYRYPKTATLTLTFGVNGVITDLLKVVVGRPRPDFFYRCFPDGLGNDDMQCTGNESDILEGRKSFPSGHSSHTFSSMGFLSLFLASKLNVYNSKGQGRSARFLLSISPIVLAAIIAASRTCDYHHHWQDVTVGSMIGLITTYTCFRQYHPPLNQDSNDITHSQFPVVSTENLATNKDILYEIKNI
ncbi:Phospholipid phosphatase 5 [Nymphon striatum]|nr:Phospholipid phosphatase 5 [Nymphon striatum]